MVTISADVTAVAELYAPIWHHLPTDARVLEVLEHHVECILAGHHTRRDGVLVQIQNHLPEFADADKVFDTELSTRQAQELAAKEHGFADWHAIDPESRLSESFEKAVDAVVTGNITSLRALLAEDPQLVSQTSPYGHGATLLIYAAANGVEMRRQSVPENAADIVSVLLEAGADRAAKA